VPVFQRTRRIALDTGVSNVAYALQKPPETGHGDPAK
jgi:hypothetical protein